MDYLNLIWQETTRKRLERNTGQGVVRIGDGVSLRRTTNGLPREPNLEKATFSIVKVGLSLFPDPHVYNLLDVNDKQKETNKKKGRKEERKKERKQKKRKQPNKKNKTRILRSQSCFLWNLLASILLYRYQSAGEKKDTHRSSQSSVQSFDAQYFAVKIKAYSQTISYKRNSAAANRQHRCRCDKVWASF